MSDPVVKVLPHQAPLVGPDGRISPTWQRVFDNQIIPALNKTGSIASDSAALGGIPAGSYALQTWVQASYLGVNAQAADSLKLNGQLASYYLDTTAIPSAGVGWLHNDEHGTRVWSVPTKSDVGLGNVENTALSTWPGSTSITTLGTVTTGSAPASDVYPWAKAVTKPSYTASEVGAPSGSGTSTGTNTGDQTLSGLGGVPLTRKITSTIDLSADRNLTYSDVGAAPSSTVTFPGFGTTSLLACVGNDARLSDSRPASDVYAWAKGATKPTYTAAEVGALASVSTLAGLAGSGTTGSPLGINYAAIVTEHGIVGDGVTDDTTALNAVLAAYRHVIVPTGLVILHSGTIIIPDFTRLQFLGALFNASTSGGSYLLKKNGMTTTSVCLGRQSQLDHGGVFGVLGSNTGDGITLLGNGGKVNDCFVQGVGGVGVRVGGPGGAGTDYNSCILDNIVASANGSHGFYIHDGSGAAPNANVCGILNCFAHVNGGDGFKLDNCYTPTLTNCLAESNTGWGLNITSNCIGTTLNGGDYLESNTSGSINNQGTNHNFSLSEVGTKTYRAQIDGASGVTKDLQYQVAGVNRMIARIDTDASYKLIPRDSSGALIDEAMKIVNASGGTIAFSSTRPITGLSFNGITGLGTTSTTACAGNDTRVVNAAQVNDLPVCMGDGVTIKFLWDGTRLIYRQDWQGKQLLYSTARTNFGPYSANLDNAAWTSLTGGTGSAPTVTADFAVGPDGTTTAERIQFNQGAGTTISDKSQWQSPTCSGLINSAATIISFWAKLNAGTSQTLLVQAGGIGTTNTVVTVTNQWVRYSCPFMTVATSGKFNIGLRGTFTTGATADVLITDVMISQEATLSSYIATGAAAVTVTDYTSPATGFAQMAVAPGTGSIMWGVSPVPSINGAATISTPANPTGTTDTTGKMMGLAGSITPTLTGRICGQISGQMANSTINDGAGVKFRYGTGTAPANAAALTGTVVGAEQTMTSLVAAQKSGFTIPFMVTGLTLGTAYWLDAGLKAITGGTATITGVTIVAEEF